MKKYIFILILFIVIIMVFVFYYTKNNKKENNIIEENFTEVTSAQVIEETEGGYKYYKTENKEQIEKIVDALENIKIGEKNDIMISDNGKTYILQLKDGTTKKYYFQGGYYNKDGVNYETYNYKELNKIELPEEK